MTPDITVCIPVYKSESTVKTAIESVLAQTYTGYHLLVSVDPADDRSAEICLSYSTDPRVTVVINPERLGWVGNVNACLDRVDTPFFAFCFHDDTLEPAFLDLLRNALQNAPKAVAAFGGMLRFGAMNAVVQPENIGGTPMSRAVGCLNNSFPAYSLKNLMRSAPVQQGLRLPQTGKQGIYADVPFALAYCLAGEFVAVPEVLYRKSHYAESVTSSWTNIEIEQLAQDWNLVRLHLIATLAKGELTFQDRFTLVQMVMNSLPRYHHTSSERMFLFTDQADLLSPALIITALTDPNNLAQANGFNPPHSQRVTTAEQRLRLAWQFCKFGEIDTARHFAQQALRLDAGLSGAHELLSWLDLNQPDTTDRPTVKERAIFHARKATELNGASATAWLHLARAQALSEHWLEVRHSAEMALSLGLSDPSIATQLLEQARAATTG